MQLSQYFSPKRLVIGVSVALALIFGSLLAFKLGAQDKAPTLSAAEKLEIREAQVQLLSAQQSLEQSPAYTAVNSARDHMNDVLQKVVKDEKVETTKWQLDNDLNFVPVGGAKPPAPSTPPPAAKVPPKKP